MAEMRSEVPGCSGERRKLGGKPQRQINDNFTGKEADLLLACVDSAGGESSTPRPAGRLAGGKNQAGSKEQPRTMPKVEVKDAKAGKAKLPVSDAGKPEESVREAGKAEESVTVGSGKLAMNQEVIGLKCTDNEEIWQHVHGGNSFIPDEAKEFLPKKREDEAKEKERVMVKEIQENMAKTKKSLIHWLYKLPTEDGECGKAEAPVIEDVKPKESDMDQEVISDNNKEGLEQVFKDKLDVLDVEEDSNRTTEPAADPNSIDRGKSALAKKTAEEEAEDYALFRNDWESDCCNNCDHFEHITVLSSMQFTHYTPGIVPYDVVETLQIFSMELKLTDDNAGRFQFPLSVYGMVAVRDALDPRRNILFTCGRTEAQELTRDDPFLHLTGPSRAIMSRDKVYFEICLKVKGAAGSQDKPLITCARRYAGGCGTALCLDNLLCTLEVCLQTVKRAVQATIVGVQILNKELLLPSNFVYGGLVACTPIPRTAADSGVNQKIVLTESKGRKMPQDDGGYLHLSRQVISAECGGGLDVVIQAYKKSGAVAAEGHFHFKAQNCQMSQLQCIIGRTQVTVAVAWSVVPTDMNDVVCGV